MVQQDSQFRIRKVSDLSDIFLNHSANYEEWGRGLTHAEYLGREQHLGSQPPCLDGNISYWSYEELQNNNQQQQQHELNGNSNNNNNNKSNWKMVSCCETLTRPAYYKIKNKPIGETICHSIGAVFTPAQYRGKGYAKKLLNYVISQFDDRNGAFAPLYDALDKRLSSSSSSSSSNKVNEEEEAKSKERFQNSFSVLWSDVEYYYNSFGYKLSSNFELVIPITKTDSNNNNNTKIIDNEIKWLTEKDVAEFSLQDEYQFREFLSADTQYDGIPRAAIIPSANVHQMTHARAHFVAPLLREHLVDKVQLSSSLLSKTTKVVENNNNNSNIKSSSKPILIEGDVDGSISSRIGTIKSVEHFGAKCGNVSMLWTQDIGNNKLNILRIIVDNNDIIIKSNEKEKKLEEILGNVFKLLNAAIKDASRWELSKITMWQQDIPRGIIVLEGEKGSYSSPSIPLFSLDDLATFWNSNNNNNTSKSLLTAKVVERPDSWPMARPLGGRKEKEQIQVMELGVMATKFKQQNKDNNNDNKIIKAKEILKMIPFGPQQELVYDGKYAWY